MGASRRQVWGRCGGVSPTGGRTGGLYPGVPCLQTQPWQRRAWTAPSKGVDGLTSSGKEMRYTMLNSRHRESGLSEGWELGRQPEAGSRTNGVSPAERARLRTKRDVSIQLWLFTTTYSSCAHKKSAPKRGSATFAVTKVKSCQSNKVLAIPLPSESQLNVPRHMC